MENILGSIEKSLLQKNWYAALILCLVLPDICAKLEGSTESSSQRYPKWFEKYMGSKYKDYLSGKDSYALRCAVLHEGISNIEKQKAKEVLDIFAFISDGAHLTKFSNCYFGDSRYDGKEFLQLSVKKFCTDFVEAARTWLRDQPSNKDFTDMIEIHEGDLRIGGINIKSMNT